MAKSICFFIFGAIISAFMMFFYFNNQIRNLIVFGALVDGYKIVAMQKVINDCEALQNYLKISLGTQVSILKSENQSNDEALRLYSDYERIKSGSKLVCNGRKFNNHNN